MKNAKLSAILLAVILLFCSCNGIDDSQNTESAPVSSETLQTETAPLINEPVETTPVMEPTNADEFGISSECAILVNITDGVVECEKNPEKRVPVASLTKIMTSLLGLENSDSSSEYTFTPELIDSLIEANAARAGFSAGESARLIDLVYAAMLPSGADGAYGVAMLVGGTQEHFVQMMNEKAKALGMNDTEFFDPIGLDDRGYSTASDMALLLKAALGNSQFREIASTHEWTTAPDSYHPDGITFRSSVFAGLENNGITNGAIKGGKTGYTEGAKLCLATFAYADDAEYILVTLGAGDGSNTPQLNFADAGILYGAFQIE